MKRRPLGLALAIGLAWLVAYPLLLVALDAFRADGAWSLANFGGFVRDPREWEALWGSLWISVASVILAAAIGIPLAFVFERFDFPGRRVLGGLVALPAVLPPLVGVIAFLFLYGESGIIPRLIAAALALPESPWRLRGAGAILLVHAYSMYVYFYLFTRAGLARVDASMTEAAASLGAGRWRTLRAVVLPLVRPQIAAAALLTFMTALGSFSAPYIFGGGFRVMPTQILATKLNGNLGLAMVETTALAVLALTALALLRRTQGRGGIAITAKGAAPGVRVLRSPLGRAAAATLGWGFAVLLLLPHATLILVSLVPLGTWTTQLFPTAYTLGNFAALAQEPERLRPLVNSLWMAAVATVGALALALWAGREVVQRRARLARPLEVLVHLPWAVPGTVLAIALATTFSVRAPWMGRWLLVGTALILPLAYLIRNLPVAAGTVLPGFRQLDPSLDEAAASLGAGRWRRLLRVTFPLLRPALLAGGALAFATAVGDFVTSIVLYTYDTRPISIEILGALRQFDIGVAAAYGVVLMLVSAAAMALGTRR
ncbi:MAG: iron ABC transporter permease [Gemmatimonadota bacterium]|nr:iron ABC transporter permease [Gemmatimonadota bacterium]MDH5196209.1 iron ABC transporter permease [Gemmatimonadota bacterium]